MSEYAPQHTVKERIRIIGLHLLWAVPVFLLLDRIFFPWMNTTNWFICYPNGLTILWYGLFVGFPCVMGIIGFVFWWIYDYPVIKLKQYPLPHRKTFAKTKYVYGFKATWRAYGLLICIAVFFATGLWGFFAATKQINDSSPQKLEQIRLKQCSVLKV